VIALVGLAAIGTAAVTEMANETVTFDNESNLTIEVEWNETLNDTSTTADVTVYGESAYQQNSTAVGNYSGTLNGTILEVQDPIVNHTTYTADLETSNASTVDIPYTAFDTSGDTATVDVTNHTSSSVTADDNVTALTTTANTVVSDSIASDAGNVTSATYNETHGLVDAREYRVIVSADDTEAKSVTVDDGSLGGLFGGSAEAGGGFVGLVGVVMVVGMAAYVAKRQGGS